MENRSRRSEWTEFRGRCTNARIRKIADQCMDLLDPNRVEKDTKGKHSLHHVHPSREAVKMPEISIKNARMLKRLTRRRADMANCCV